MDNAALVELRGFLTVYRSHCIAPDDAKTDRQVVAVIEHVKKAIATEEQRRARRG